MKHALSEASLPRGFRFAATACGLKKTGALDLAILSSDIPASAAAVFTQNLVAAARSISRFFQATSPHPPRRSSRKISWLPRLSLFPGSTCACRKAACAPPS